MPAFNNAVNLPLFQIELIENDTSVEQRQVVAALEWDSVYAAHSDSLEHQSISREHYVAIAKSLILDVGETQIDVITQRGLGIWVRRSTLGLDLLPLRVDVVKFYKYLATDSNLKELESVILELEREGEICAIPLKNEFFFCRTNESPLSSLDNRSWRSAIGEHFESHVSWLSAI